MSYDFYHTRHTFITQHVSCERNNPLYSSHPDVLESMGAVAGLRDPGKAAMGIPMGRQQWGFILIKLVGFGSGGALVPSLYKSIALTLSNARIWRYEIGIA